MTDSVQRFIDWDAAAVTFTPSSRVHQPVPPATPAIPAVHEESD